MRRFARLMCRWRCVYFTYGALGLIDVSRDLWVKDGLTLTPSELAAIGIWLTLPWTIKMVFGELVDCVPIFGSQRQSLHPDRRRLDGVRPSHPRRRGRPVARFPCGLSLRRRFTADRARHRHSGCRR